jgi:hypothetical protein
VLSSSCISRPNSGDGGLGEIVGRGTEAPVVITAPVRRGRGATTCAMSRRRRPSRAAVSTPTAANSRADARRGVDGEAEQSSSPIVTTSMRATRTSPSRQGAHAGPLLDCSTHQQHSAERAPPE